MPEPVRVLIVDDSAFMRQLIKEILSQDPALEVVGIARDGLDCLNKIGLVKPHVITLDVEMPNLNGLATLREIIKTQPLPVVMLSSLTVRGADTTLQALDLGAVDFAAKPHRADQTALASLAKELPLKVRAAARVDVARLRRRPVAARGPLTEPTLVSTPSTKPLRGTGPSPQVMVVGASTGGPSALNNLLVPLPQGFPLGVVVAQHMPPGFTKYLAQRLDSLSPLTVKEAREGDVVQPGAVLIGPAGKQIRLQRRSGQVVVTLDDGHKELYRPSVDNLFSSAAQVWGAGVLALILTGMGEDGRRGLELVKAKGGYVLAEAEESCVVYGMPQAAVKAGVVDEVFPIHQLSQRVVQLTGV